MGDSGLVGGTGQCRVPRRARLSARSARPLRIALLGAALLAAPLPAREAAAQPTAAQPSKEQVKKATGHFEKGSRLYDQKKFALALTEFKSSYDSVKSPNSHLYVARCMAALGETREAWLEFDATANEADERAKTEEKYVPTRDTARLERDELNAKIGLVTVEVKNADPTAKLRVAGNDVAAERWGKPVPVAPGDVEVVLEPASGAAVRQQVAVAAGESKQVSVDAAPPAAPVPVAATSADADVDAGLPTDRSKLRPWAYVAGGVGVAGLVMFTVAGLMSRSTYSELEDSCGNGPCASERQSDIDAGQTQQTLANVGLVVGIVGVGAGVTLFFLSRGGSVAPPTETGKVTLTPEIGLGRAGVRGTF
ncbi:MAG: tetratricopeptide repeat protein [Polyangiaceae bacterium]